MIGPALRFDEVLPGVYDPEWTQPLSVDIPHGLLFVIRTTPLRSAAFFRLCLGLMGAGQGTVEVLGTDPGTLDRAAGRAFRRQLGVALLPDGLLSNLSLRMNLVVPMVYSGAATVREAHRAADDILAAVGLLMWAQHRPAAVPPDVREQAVIARAIVSSPKLVLLEDPFSAIKSRDVASLLGQCRERADTIVIATHRRNEALYRYADVTAFWDEQGFRTEATHEVGSS